jgi:hypothetical protein
LLHVPLPIQATSVASVIVGLLNLQLCCRWRHHMKPSALCCSTEADRRAAYYERSGTVIPPAFSSDFS